MAARSLEGLKVVSAHEMARIESIAYAEGASELTFMENAGRAVADAAENFITSNDLTPKVTLLIGKGNNGGDAFAAGIKLMECGIKTVALPIYPIAGCSPICKTMYEKYQSCGGMILPVQDPASLPFESEGIILDGLVGTGFKGKAEGPLALAIDGANRSGLPILAIDIPSGLNGTTGEVETVAIHATETIFLGLPKSGFFLRDGWEHVGILRYACFGLDAKYVTLAKAEGCLLDETSIPSQLPSLKRTRHKYQAGYVLAVAGSFGMPGAALLSSYAALRAGAGIVRLFHPCGMESELSSAPFELIRQGWNGKKIRVISQEAIRARALLLGPGMGKTKQTKKIVQSIFENIDLPIVIDADALFFLAENPSWKLPKRSVLTPHRGEMDLLLAKDAHINKAERTYQERCQDYVEAKNVTLVLKGAPSFIFHPGKVPLIVTRGDPGMATAGSGDVLTGIIAAMLAQGLEPRVAAAIAVYLHGVSGEAAAGALTSYCMTASDLIDFLPEAFP